MFSTIYQDETQQYWISSYNGDLSGGMREPIQELNTHMPIKQYIYQLQQFHWKKVTHLYVDPSGAIINNTNNPHLNPKNGDINTKCPHVALNQ